MNDLLALTLNRLCHSALGWRRSRGDRSTVFGGAMRSSRPPIFGHAGRVTLSLRRPWQAMRLAYDRFTVLSFVPFICQFNFVMIANQVAR